jgi:hypothetical protein
MKLYIDGIEDPSWRIVQQWDLGEKGEAVIPLSYALVMHTPLQRRIYSSSVCGLSIIAARNILYRKIIS